MTDEEAKELEGEIEILKQCQHAYIVGYYGTCKKNGKLWILMDYCAMGSIKDLMKACSATLSEAQIAYVCYSTVQGLIYLHARNVIHRDVKAANILLTEDGKIKLADFGVSEQLSSAASTSNKMIGTPLWMAPEVILKQKYDN